MATVRLREAARQLVVLTFAQALVLVLMGAGTLAPPDQTSLDPPPTCSAPFSYYQNAALLAGCFAPAAIGTVSLAGLVASALRHAGGLEQEAAATPARLRVLAMFAGALSATSAALALAALYMALQARAGLVSCIPGLVRVPLYAGYVVVGAVLAYFYAGFCRVVLSRSQ